MVLSRQKARKPPTNISVDKRTVRIWSSSGTPTPFQKNQHSPIGWSTLAWYVHSRRPALTGFNGVGVRVQVCRQSETKEHRKPENKEVPGGVQVHQLQVGEADGCDHTWTSNIPPSLLQHTCNHRGINVTCNSPNSVQNIPPRIGSGSEAKRAVNFPTDPNTNMMAAPYCTTRLLPTCMDSRKHQYTLTHVPCKTLQMCHVARSEGIDLNIDNLNTKGSDGIGSTLARWEHFNAVSLLKVQQITPTSSQETVTLRSIPKSPQLFVIFIIEQL